MRRHRLRRTAQLGVAAALLAAGATPATADGFGAPQPPPSTTKPQRDTVQPNRPPQQQPADQCRVYASASGFGMLCSSKGNGLTYRALAAIAGIDLSKPFCWDDSDLPDGFDPASQGVQPEGTGRWWLHTCLVFEGEPSRETARVSYEYRFRLEGQEDELKPVERDFITQVLGRGQIPYLQVQTSPISSPRVDQDVAFSMLCSPKVQCEKRDDGWHIETPRLRVGGVVMHAELVHLRVLPEGVGEPGKAVGCRFAGLHFDSATELDELPLNDPRVCRYSYKKSSDGAGSGLRGDRYPVKVTAYWQVFYDDGNGPRAFAEAYEKSSTNLIRVTEVQTLVVS